MNMDIKHIEDTGEPEKVDNSFFVITVLVLLIVLPLILFVITIRVVWVVLVVFVWFLGVLSTAMGR